ncbi:hypothetical protein SAMN05444000_11951 [Shimia gijangensis]|uniref:Uncharacterized protein n=1 Tax=Shimia gijangensis TaxID=1470563 RepID=A0A1M6PU88_9RHOB|nr:hypothetical protein [Shimia gijangensis]SHK11533.1 hypothetical protein SAMN05444000_11951 [Shimia gijangensis]
MRLTISAIAVMLTPVAAQAIVVTPYREISLQCQSVQTCQTNGTCAVDTSRKVVLSFEEAVYRSSYAPFTPKREAWPRAVVVTGRGEVTSKVNTTYRTLSKVLGADAVWRKANFEERVEGWFGPELPVARKAGSPAAEPSYQIFQTQTQKLETPTVFKTKARSVIEYKCKEMR